MAHALAGKPVQEQDIIDVQTIVDAYFDNVPDMTNPTQLVSFGTSGHRGTSLDGTFTDLHVAAIWCYWSYIRRPRYACIISARTCDRA